MPANKNQIGSKKLRLIKHAKRETIYDTLNGKPDSKSVKKPEEPQRNFVLKSCIEIVSNNKTLLYPADLVEPLPFSSYFKGVL